MNRGGQILWMGSPSRAGVEVFDAELCRELSEQEMLDYRPQVQAVGHAYRVVNDQNTEAKDLLENVKRSFGLRDPYVSETQRATTLRSTFGPVSFQPSTSEASGNTPKQPRQPRRNPGKGPRPR